MKIDACHIVEGPYLADILDQPRALQATWERMEPQENIVSIAQRLRSGEFKRVVLTGMGSSFYALHPLSMLLNSSGYTAVIMETSELVHYTPEFLEEQTLIVAVSQSGQSAEILRLLDSNGGRAPIIGVTNTVNSPLSLRSTATLLTEAGLEFSVSAKTYVSALIALQTLGAAFCGIDLERTLADLALAPKFVANYLEDWREHVRSIAIELTGIMHMFLVGRGRSLGAVGTGALIMKESTGFHAEGMSSAAFRHGPMEMLGPQTLVAVFQGDAPTAAFNYRLLHDVQKENGRCVLIGEDGKLPAWKLPNAPAALLPVLEILPVQMMTLALAAQSGIEAGRFTLATKITTVE